MGRRSSSRSGGMEVEERMVGEGGGQGMPRFATTPNVTARY
jgi:hypothetical protein